MSRMGYPDTEEKIPTPGVRLDLPNHLQRRYLRGLCGALAVALQRQTGFPLWGMFEGEDGPLHHAFVRDPASGLALDVRGSMEIERVAEGAAVTDPVFRPIVRTDINEAFGPSRPQDIRDAGYVARVWFRTWDKTRTAPEP